MLATKMDLLMRKLSGPEPSQALEVRMTCKHCGNTGHTSKDCPTAQDEECCFISDNSWFRPQEGFNQGWNNRPNLSMEKGNNFARFGLSFKDIIANQNKINKNISKKFLAHDKILETIDGKLEAFSSALQSQLSHNKML